MTPGVEGLDECLDNGGKTKDGSVILNDGAENDQLDGHNSAIIPKSLYSASDNCKTRCKFLTTLSADMPRMQQRSIEPEI